MSAIAEAADLSATAQAPVISYVGENYARGAGIPWPLKMGLKIGLSYLKFSYGFWAKLGIFKHGDLAVDLKGLWKGFDDHFSYYKERYGKAPDCCLELGPGDSLGHALAAKAAGTKNMWFVDVGDFATTDAAHYRAFYDYIVGQGMTPFENPSASFDRAAVKDYTNSVYGTTGLQSMKDVPADRIDFSFSHAVLEHIGRGEFADYMKELYRVHKKGSVSRHWVDLHDHLGGALNSMRFPAGFWESGAVRQAGFYTNRLTMAEMVAMATEAGFSAEIVRVNKWKTLPTPRAAMHKDFKNKSDDELNVCTFLIVLTKIEGLDIGG